ncbi:MAG TPA: hypothetical protein VHY34_09010 [Caulobacteraceae bacterium]|jgi:Flp pilus assembly protein TadB|nr:hypothetical protein [Caulobacteraceae bacterium]
MNEELEAFRDALRQAGQPWSRRGVTTVGVGIVGLFVSQVAPWRQVAAASLLVSLAVVMVGWVFLVIAFIKRRRWARANPLIEPTLADNP